MVDIFEIDDWHALHRAIFERRVRHSVGDGSAQVFCLLLESSRLRALSGGQDRHLDVLDLEAEDVLDDMLWKEPQNALVGPQFLNECFLLFSELLPFFGGTRSEEGSEILHLFVG